MLGNARRYMWNNLHINIFSLPNGDHTSSHAALRLLVVVVGGGGAFTAIWNRRRSVFAEELKQRVSAHFAGNIHRCCICGSACQICHSAFSSYLYHPESCGILVGGGGRGVSLGVGGTSVSHYILRIVLPQILAPPPPPPTSPTTT